MKDVLKEYLIYAYYDDVMNYVGVFKADTPNELIEQAKQTYRRIKFE